LTNIRGDLWREKIVKAIKTTDAFVLMLLRIRFKSANVQRAVSGNVKTQPVPHLLFVDVPDKLMYQLSESSDRVSTLKIIPRLVEVLRTHQRTLSACRKLVS
jgi:hypothetical protein